MVPAGDGCDKSLAWWFTDEPWAKPTQKPAAKPQKPKFATLADLPKACALVLNGPAPASEQEATYGTAYRAPAAIPAAATSIEAVISAAGEGLPANIPVPLPRPGLQ